MVKQPIWSEARADRIKDAQNCPVNKFIKTPMTNNPQAGARLGVSVAFIFALIFASVSLNVSAQTISGKADDPSATSTASTTSTAALAGAPAAPTNTTAPTRSLLPLVQPLWSELSPNQASALAPMASQWNNFTLADKRSWIKLANGFAKLPADQQKKATARMVEWTQLTPEQRLRVRSNFGIAQKVPQEQRVAEFQQYRSMTPEQRRVLRSAGTTSNTAALYAGTRTGLAPEAAQPIIKTVVPPATIKR